MATTMTYGNYSFSPVPLMQISTENKRHSDNAIVGQTTRIILNGTVTPLPNGSAGYVNVDALQDSLATGLSVDGRRFYISCNGAEILDVYPRVNKLSFDPTSDNWVNRANYSVELEFDSYVTGNISSYINDSSENWTLEFITERSYFSSDLSAVSNQYAGNYYALDSSPYSLRMTHSLSAIGTSHYSGPGVTGTLDRAGWQEAQSYVLGRLGSNNTILASSGVINLDVSQFQYYNHVRNQVVDELDGGFNVVESWLVINPSGTGVPGNVLEDFSTDVRKGIDTDLTTVSINGRIEGLETVSYGTTTGDYTISESKYAAATSGWNTIKNRILSRAQIVSQDVSTRPLNSGVRTRSIIYNPTQGIISYNYEYDDRAYNCITGALYENIIINDTNPTNVFASLTVLGRTAGPVLQDMGTVTAAARDVHIDAIMPIPTGCTVAKLLTNKPTSQVDAMLCAFELDLSGTYSQLFLQNDIESWNPTTGKYSRDVRWTFGQCNGTVSTVFCS